MADPLGTPGAAVMGSSIEAAMRRVDCLSLYWFKLVVVLSISGRASPSDTTNNSGAQIERDLNC